jgi:thiamine biosynthesis lipoprotein
MESAALRAARKASMGKLLGVLCIVAGLPSAACVAFSAEAARPALVRYEFTQIEMAVSVRIVLYSPDAATATRAAKAAFDRIHKLNGIMSDYDPTSELRKLCDTAGQGRAVAVSPELFAVLDHAMKVSARSDGAFDVTVGPVVRLWRRARRQSQLPKPEAVKEALSHVGYKYVRLDSAKQTVELLKPGMQLDLGGIAKGYAMDEGLRVIQEAGIRRALVSAGGDMRLGDPPPDKPGWTVAIPPLDEPNGKPTETLMLSRVAVSTSGDVIQFVEIGGKRYSHIVDPRTGIPLTDHCRVIVVGPSGMAADAITKAVGVLGPEKGLKLIEQTPDMAALVTRKPAGKLEQYESAKWKELSR